MNISTQRIVPVPARAWLLLLLAVLLFGDAWSAGLKRPGSPSRSGSLTLVLSSVVTDDDCNVAGLNGAVDLTVAGGQSPYGFIWNIGATTEDLTLLSAGTYTVIVTDANGLTASETVVVGLANAADMYTDSDGDGYGTGSVIEACFPTVGLAIDDGDCDDTDSAIHPDATEVCNTIDDNCDGNIDGNDPLIGTLPVWYADVDGDGYGDPLDTQQACFQPTGFVSNDEDCDDGADLINPLGTEDCNTLDDDCDGQVDEGLLFTWFADSDGDGFGNPALSTASCYTPVGYVADDSDCDDSNAAVNSGATETCNSIDDDCDGNIDNVALTTYYADSDNDGFGDPAFTAQAACSPPAGFVTDNSDCDDGSAAVYPSATETCNTVDDNCDGAVDEGLELTWYRDADGDGSGDASLSTDACYAPPGYVADDADCNDANAAVSPNATEVCNSIDDDCDGNIDNIPFTTYYADVDGDGYGDSNFSLQVGCNVPASGYVTIDGDCDDSDASINPGATEVCNTADDDCDGSIDEGVELPWFADVDGDGFGDASATVDACYPPVGYVGDDSDCDDLNAAVNTSATEVCNGIDDDCDSNVDNVPTVTWYADIDNDGFGDPNFPVQIGCQSTAGLLLDNSDCDDTNPLINPNGTESCNAVDDDCDGSIDEGLELTWYRDADGDGFGDPAVTSLSCSLPVGYVADNTDCNDAEATVNPNGTETCNLIDDNCDGSIDEGVQLTWYVDADGDGSGDASSSTLACLQPAGYAIDNADCDDNNAAVYPDAQEVCNGLDDNCDNNIDDNDPTITGQPTWYADSDGDGYGDISNSAVSCSAPAGFVAAGTDCDDADASINPGATETCDGRDEDCDGVVDNGITFTNYYADFDGDGFGTGPASSLCVAPPAGYASQNGDCDDSNAAINPDAQEVCDAGIDNDCDGTADDNDLSATGQLTWFVDSDGDGYGSGTATVQACDQPTGYAIDNSDCDDSNSAVHPDASEVCNSIDDDCDSDIDDNDPSLTGAPTWYTDSDSDGYGDLVTARVACQSSPGEVNIDSDCDDGDPDINPAATELCNAIDDDCDGTVDNGITYTNYYADFDGDGYGAGPASSVCIAPPSGYASLDGDCDDSNAAINPGVQEICDFGIDNDCDGLADDADASVAGQLTWFTDSDGDGYGSGSSSVQSCEQPAGYAIDNSDCDDSNAAVNPDAQEVCNNGIDDDCDGDSDDNDPSVSGQTTWYADADGDGYGDSGISSVSCNQPAGHSSAGGDCDDSDASVNPGATEVCNNLDDDCDGAVDNGLTFVDYFADFDGDGYGAGPASNLCEDPGAGYANQDGDCDDSNVAINPAAQEVCDLGVDNDCDGLADDADGFVSGQLTWHADSDADGFGNAAVSQIACDQPAGYVIDDSDCDDSNSAVNPDAQEICNTIDDDCDGDVDDDDASVIGQSTWYSDIDADTYGDASVSQIACFQPVGYVLDNTDCDDGDLTINPAAAEICDNIDNDCDGLLDSADPNFVDTTAPVSAAIPDATGECSVTVTAPSATDNCSGTVTGTTSDPLSYSAQGTYTITWTFNDGNGNSSTATQTVIVDDVTAPAAPSIADATGECSATVSAPTATDTCAGSVTGTTSDPLTYSAQGTYTITWSFNDGNGNTSTATQTVIVDDVTAPSAPSIADATGECSATVSAPTAIDNCAGSVTGTTSDPLTYSSQGTYTVTWSFNDGNGNTSTATQTVIVDDVTNPVLGACPADVNQCSPIVTWTAPSASDNCGIASLVSSHNSGDTFPVGTTTVTYTATDIAGNTSTCSFDVTVQASPLWYADADGDTYGDPAVSQSSCTQPSGYVSDSSDCNDNNAAINPAATEVCDGGVDNDCDGLADNADNSVTGQLTWYADADGDGFGNPAVSQLSCDQPAGYSIDNADCDDSNAAVNPDEQEICNTIDDDCDGDVDDNDASVSGQPTWYADVDGDTYGDISAAVTSCVQPSGYVSNNTDCDDADATVNPAATEVCNGTDDDCDGSIDEGSTFTNSSADFDADGYGAGPASSLCQNPGPGYASLDGDCNDNNAAINPGATEVCDGGVDNDCDGLADDNDPSTSGIITWYADSDNDGFGSGSSSVLACNQPSGYSIDNADCDDSNAAVNPDAAEVCNGIDDDCDGDLDDNDPSVTGQTTWYADADADGYGDNSLSSVSCAQPSGYVSTGGDCDDADAAVNPGATEVCNDKDDDCDGSVDEGLTFIDYYADFDGDDFGVGPATNSCEDPGAGYASADGDCDDTNAAINPGATEVCDGGVDNDCDGLADDADSNVSGQLTWYADSDGDTFGTSGTSVSACVQPSGYVLDDGDCDDSNAAVNPDAQETCNTIDDDCDGDVDDDDASVVGQSTWYADVDADTYGDAGTSQVSCFQPSGYVSDNTDCDDGDASINPGATEVCNGEDDDCDGTADEGLTFVDYYTDADGDTYGTGAAQSLCSNPGAGFATQAGDCDDSNAAINPAATEICDNIDNDCDGAVDSADPNFVDTTAPVAPSIANATGECSVTVTAPTATDNCVGSVTGTTSDPLSYSAQGTYTITWSFNDGNGNTSTATQTVIVDDVTAPVAPTLSTVTGQCSATVT
ncbi:MAG: MopE-related protein, partial [Bacteroidota bacterium]